MVPRLNPIPGAMSDIYAQVTRSKEVTLADRYGMQALLLADRLEEEDRHCLDRLLYGLRRGRLRLSNKLSQYP